MDRLPNELLAMLLGYLEFADLLSCRVVSKRFRYFVDWTRIEELVVASSPAADPKKSCFVTGAMIDIARNAISPSAFNGCRFVFNLSAHLKRLCLSFHKDLTFNMAILDRMRIEQLDVKCTFLGSNQAVELPDLKILELTVADEDEENIFFVQAPKLTKLRTGVLHAVCLDFPEALLYLDTKRGAVLSYVNSESELELCGQFKNLEVLRVKFMHEEILATFERLKRLEIVGRSDDGVGRKQLQAYLKHLVQQAKLLTDLQLYFYGVRLVDGRELDDLPEQFELLDLQLRNYRSLADADLSFVTEIDHAKLMRFFDDNQLELPADSFSKFFNIQKVTTSAPADKDRFFNFIQSCPLLVDLELVDSALSKWLNDLPKFCDLKRLKVEDSRFFDINFDFILKFRHLESFEGFVNCLGSFYSLAIPSFVRLEKLEWFCFQKWQTNDFIQISKGLNTYYFLASCDSGQRVRKRVGGINELMDLCIETKHGKLDRESQLKEMFDLESYG